MKRSASEPGLIHSLQKTNFALNRVFLSPHILPDVIRLLKRLIFKIICLASTRKRFQRFISSLVRSQIFSRPTIVFSKSNVREKQDIYVYLFTFYSNDEILFSG